jgi:hypothetical protein
VSRPRKILSSQTTLVPHRAGSDQHCGQARQAQNVTISLASDAVMLEISDDGHGFAPAGPFPGRLGLKSMQESAQDRCSVTPKIRAVIDAPKSPSALTLSPSSILNLSL